MSKTAKKGNIKKKTGKRKSASKDPVIEIGQLVNELEQQRQTKVFFYLLMPMKLGRDLVEQTYELLENHYSEANDLDVIVTSSGGDIHSAFHLAKLFRRYAPGKLRFIVPRYAKSAATLLIFGGDEIVFGPTSEMGPLDPQIQLSARDNISVGERFSPLAIRPTLDLIAEEEKKGHNILVEKLSASLPEALLLGQHLKALDIAKHYVTELLTTRMLKGEERAKETADNIGEKLVRGYPDHACCIDYDDALSLGLRVITIPKDQWNLVWQIWRKAEQFMKETTKKALKSIAAKHDILDATPPPGKSSE